MRWRVNPPHILFVVVVRVLAPVTGGRGEVGYAHSLDHAPAVSSAHNLLLVEG